MTPGVAEADRLDFLGDYISAVDLTGKISAKDARDAELLFEIALLLSAAGRKEKASADDVDHLFACKANIVKAVMRTGWNSEVVPQLQEASNILDGIAEEEKPSPESLGLDGSRLSLALGSTLSTLNRCLTVLTGLFNLIEHSQFNIYFQPESLIRIAEKAKDLGGEIAGLTLPNLSATNGRR